MSSIIASHIPKTVPLAKLKEFFSFCGKIQTINPIDSKEEKFQSVEVIFESEKALQTALLLNEAELEGVSIKVEAASKGGLPSYSSATSDNKIQSEVTSTGDEEYDDVSQEEKPKYAIMAQLLSSGYVVSDQLIDRAIQTDSQKGYSTKFMSFLDKLDNKFVHSKVPDSTANKTVESAQNTLSGWTNAFNKSSYKNTLDHYYESAASHPYGKKVASFYKTLAKDAQSVHEEARRLAELKKKKEAATPTSGTAATSTSEPLAVSGEPEKNTTLYAATDKPAI
ncbi:putative protein Vip1p [[Candida] railenensis]|uniref:RRM domain-containing protein n=1 Tax=[Candida] railenensis TaxID=45579 RepID=A0A9P0QVM1_9ASCO|nr:putative protein Vip1p [[Candida] railenensis]